MANNFKILAISTSLRNGSFNTMAVNSLAKLAPADVEIEIFSIGGIPLFNEDMEGEIDQLPESVKQLIEAIKNSNAMIVSSPEYNNMIPGVTKNLFDWMSRKYIVPLIANKPLGIMGASDGDFGTVRSIRDLMFLAAYLGMRINGSWRVPIPRAQDKFDSNGVLTDESTKNRMVKLIENLRTN